MMSYIKLTPKLHERRFDGYSQYIFKCPGCEEPHVFYVGPKAKLSWEYNGDPEKPTFNPSLLMGDDTDRCHLVLTDGQIHYCGDCSHKLAGQVVEMVDYRFG